MAGVPPLSRRVRYARTFAIAVALGVHGVAFLALTVEQKGVGPTARPAILNVVLIERIFEAPAPVVPLAPAQSPRFLAPQEDTSTAITLPDLMPGIAPAAPGLGVLAEHMRCTLPEYRDKKDCERLRAGLKGKDSPRRPGENERIMMARIDREMARRNAPTAVPCIGVSRSGMSCIAAPEWNDQHFNWK